jgi:GT2 family glycosyltransferase
MTKLAIITVTYNSASVIEPFLQALLAQNYPHWQLYLIDSASTDSTMQQIARYADSRIRLLPQVQNIGFAAGNNLAIQQAIIDGCDEFLLINNDTEFAAEFLSILLVQRHKYPSEVLTPKIYYYNPINTIWSAGGGFKPRHAWAAYHLGENEIDFGQYDRDSVCEFVPMCCVLIPLSAWLKVGELDAKYFIYSEDADWFYRAKLTKTSLHYCYEPVIYHKVSSLTGGSKSYSGAYYGSRNRAYFICKHFAGWQRMAYLSKYFVGMFVALVTKKYTWQEFSWRLPAFFKGIKL